METTTKAKKEVLEIIDQFLEDWKQRNIQYFLSAVKSFKKQISYKTQLKEETIELLVKEFGSTDTKEFKSVMKYQIAIVNLYTDKLNSKADNLDFWEDIRTEISLYIKRKKELQKTISKQQPLILDLASLPPEDRESYLVKILDKEMVHKKEKFIKTIVAHGGDILRVLTLNMGDNGMINGYVSCVNCDVSIETIGAGGYNIQRYHYRVLIKKLAQRKNEYLEEDLKSYNPLEAVSHEVELENEFKKRILAQAERLETKVLANKKSRGKDIWDKIQEYGYLQLLKERNYTVWFNTPSYPVYRVKLNKQMKFGKGRFYKDSPLQNATLVYCMAFAYLIPDDAKSVSDLRSIWNVEGTDSMSRVETYMENLEHDEYKLLTKLMVKRGEINPYNPSESVEEQLTVDNSEHYLYPSAKHYTITEISDSKSLYKTKNEYNAFVSLMHLVDLHEEENNFKGVAIWKRILENNYDTKFKELGYRVLAQTKYYPILYKELDNNSAIAFTPTCGYEFDGDSYKKLYYFCRDSNYTSRLKDIQSLAETSKLEDFKVLYDCMNGRKKLTPYVSENKTKPAIKNSLYNALEKFDKSFDAKINYQKIVSCLPLNLDRYNKIEKRIVDNNYVQALKEDNFKPIGKIKGIDFYYKQFKSGTILLITYQSAFIVTPDAETAVSKYYDLNSPDYNIDSVLSTKIVKESKALQAVVNANNLRRKLIPYKK